MKKIILALLPVFCFSMSLYGQGKLTRNQVLDAIRNHQQHSDTITVADTDTIKCDSRTTSIELYVSNDSCAMGYSYLVSCSNDGVELTIYDQDNVIYRSIYDYSGDSYSDLKTKINKLPIVKISSEKDDEYLGIDKIIRFYRGESIHESIESYSGRTNANKEFHTCSSLIKSFVPEIKEILFNLESAPDTLACDSTVIDLSFDVDIIRFKAKGNEFKKVKVNCTKDNWSILEGPEWITYSLNNNNEIILESKPNDSKSKREGDIIVICGIIKKLIHIIQAK